MKKLHLLLLSVTLCLFAACHDDIWDAIDGLDSRVTKLEELCKEMNTNITSLQTIVDVLQANDYITGIVEIKKNGEVIGYTITFGKHDPITIYHGQDGKDGADGKDGQDSSANAPVIGVAQDTDGVYYWTLNGDWLLDDNGNKLPVSGKDGQNGVNGTMPQLKIEEGYWYVSYDNGGTWTQLGKATGEEGEKGDKGDTGDSMFQSITQDENYVYLTLVDGTIIKIPMGHGHQSSMGDGYVTSGIANGYYYVDLDLPSGTKWATCNIGSNRPEGPGHFFKWSKTTRIGATDTTTLSSPPIEIYHTQYDAATINWGDNWAIPTKEHFTELLEFANWTYTTYNDVAGWKVSGPNGNSIFLPTIGYYNSTISADYLFYSSSTSDNSGEYVYCLCDYKYNAYADVVHIRKYPYVAMEMDYYKSVSAAENFRPFYTKDGYPIRPVLVE
jgi:hypothetical protein